MCFTACRTPDLGPARWEELDSGTRASLRGLHAVDASTVWASGSGGTLLRSVDGGRTFLRWPVPGEAGNELRDVHGFDADTAFFIACQPARVYRTKDGGRTFDIVLDPEVASAFFDGLSFFDRAHGIVFGDPIEGRFMVFTTDDGGTTWQRVPPEALPRALPGEGGFAASGTCLAVLPGGRAWIGTGITGARVMQSVDWGRTWRVVPTGVDSGPSAGIFSLAFRDRRFGVAVGGDYLPGSRSIRRAATTVDGGQTWRVVTGAPTRGFRSCVSYVPGRPRTCIAVGPTGTDVSMNDGQDWRALSDEGFHVVSIAPDGTAFAAGADGRVARLLW